MACGCYVPLNGKTCRVVGLDWFVLRVADIVVVVVVVLYHPEISIVDVIICQWTVYDAE